MSDLTVEVGFGAADLTPPPGLEMTGFSARTEPATGVHDHLYVRSFYLKGATGPESSLLLLTFDLIGLSQALVKQVKEQIQEHFGVPGGRILLACSHTHGGPATLDHEFLGKHDINYLSSIPGRVVEAAGQAITGTVPANLYLAEAQAENAGKNRNVEGGPMDSSVGVLAVTEPDSEQLLGMVLNYTCHPTVLGPKNLLYTADYPYYTNRLIAQATGLSPNRILFTQGACGNINAGHTAKSSMTAAGLSLRTYEEAEKLGGNVGKAALQALAAIQMNPAEHRLDVTPAVPVLNEKVNLDWDPEEWPTPAFLSNFKAEKEAILAAGNEGGRGDAAVLARWSGLMLEEKLNPVWPPLQAGLTATRLGHLAWVSFPGELYVEYGKAIKEKARQAGYKAWVLGYTNGDFGYYPTPDAFDRKDYEAASAYRYYGYPGPFNPRIGDQIGAAGIKLLEEIINK
ncbi:MAG TPA: neutral/alkaline non-lysosomal ceramidase N-terminal domain-containing protein [Chloroflexia bacterium]|nr:neutral/alkaline non-lysosomal ceramidase N-terminal domain-containing protein [Chloroflexia bacterium]